jgi:EAL and modified HD-GYP domain-containing signal transduction protein
MMSTSSPIRPAAGEILVARQPVVDSRMRLRGYRIAYATAASAAPTGLEALELFDDVFSVVGLEELVGTSMAHLPVSREMLMRLGVPPVRPDRVVLRVDYADAISDEIATVLQTATERGYTLELGGLPGPDFDLALLDRFGVVEIDIPSWTPEQAKLLLPKIAARHGVAIAARIPDHAHREVAERVGFDWFAGPFLATPNVVSGRKLPAGELATLVDVARLQNENTPLEDVLDVIDKDIGLGVRLLRYINSAHFGFRMRVNSIRQAAVLLGSRGVARWALLIATFSCAPKAPRELVMMGLTRASLCERLAAQQPGADPDQLFTVGLLSTVDALVGMPLEQIIAELPLTPEVSDALLQHSGPAGRILEAVLAYEKGEFATPMKALEMQQCGGVYRKALGWARSALAGLS